MQMFTQVLFVCVCFVAALSSAQSTIDEDNEVDEDLVHSPMIYQNIMDRLKQLHVDVIQLKNIVSKKNTCTSLARDNMCRACNMLSPVCPSATPVDRSKTVEVKIMQFSQYGSRITLLFWWLSFIQKF